MLRAIFSKIKYNSNTGGFVLLHLSTASSLYREVAPSHQSLLFKTSQKLLRMLSFPLKANHVQHVVKDHPSRNIFYWLLTMSARQVIYSKSRVSNGNCLKRYHLCMLVRAIHTRQTHSFTDPKSGISHFCDRNETKYTA